MIFVAKIYMSHYSPPPSLQLYTIIQKKNLTDDTKKVLTKNIMFNVIQLVFNCQTGAAVQIVVFTDNVLNERTLTFKNLYYTILLMISHKRVRATTNETSDHATRFSYTDNHVYIDILYMRYYQ